MVLKNILASVYTNCIGEETERKPCITLSTGRDEAQVGIVVMEDIKLWIWQQALWAYEQDLDSQ